MGGLRVAVSEPLPEMETVPSVVNWLELTVSLPAESLDVIWK